MMEVANQNVAAEVVTDLFIQVNGIDADLKTPRERNDQEEICTIRLYGRSVNGGSVCVRVEGYCPALVVRLKKLDAAVTSEDVDYERLFLDLNKLISNGKTFTSTTSSPVACHDVLFRSDSESLIKLRFSSAKVLREFRELIRTNQGNLKCSAGRYHIRLGNDCSLSLEQLFLCDLSLKMFTWIKVVAGKFQVIEKSARQSNCDSEVQVIGNGLSGLGCIMKERLSNNVSLRLMSFDIECLPGGPTHTQFVKTQYDPIIQIACVFVTFTGAPLDLEENEGLEKIVFVTGTCAPVPGAQVISCDGEKDLLIAWANFFYSRDPDILIGYNIGNFDIKYIVERSLLVGVDNLKTLGRRVSGDPNVKYESNADNDTVVGSEAFLHSNVPGRIVLDVFRWAVQSKRKYNFFSVDLQTVSQTILGESKLAGVLPTIIWALQNESDETRQTLANYCLTDAILPLKITNKMFLLNRLIAIGKLWSCQGNKMQANF